MQVSNISVREHHVTGLEKFTEVSSLINKSAVESLQVLKSNQLAAFEAIILLLLREVELMKKLEERVREGINGGGICLYNEMQRFEASMIRSALIQAGGVQRKAAELLGMKITTLNVKIKRYKIDFSSYSDFNED